MTEPARLQFTDPPQAPGGGDAQLTALAGHIARLLAVLVPIRPIRALSTQTGLTALWAAHYAPVLTSQELTPAGLTAIYQEMARRGTHDQ